ncbi:uncharacterized protein LOC131247347 [Magnolia sinica]|uniref:uncharacterized protein LOC131247347 n=1 Tax=Magnolia sinica TaxID=86752 RepID=UPI002657DABA|nr:uncharacterized protein LOC131247347 [Magnolia sinica]
MKRSRTCTQASPQEGTTATTSSILVTADPQLENHQSTPSKGKQVIVKESREGDSYDESSTSLSRYTISDENETERENQGNDYEEGEVDISGEDDIIVEDVPADEGHTLPTFENLILFIYFCSFLLSYLIYFISSDHVVNTKADNTSPIDLPPVVPATSPRFSMHPRVVACEIAFLVESTDLPTPTTVDSSTEPRAPSFAEMAEPDPSLVRETQLLAVSAPAKGNLPQSGMASSGSIGTSSNVLSFKKVSAYKLALIRNSILAIIEMFKDLDQWSDLAIALDVLDSVARMAKVNVSSVRDALLRFHNSITVLSSDETAIVPPKILEYRKQLVYSKEKVSQISPIVSRHDQEQLSLREQLKTFADNKTSIQDRITLLK